MPTATVSSDLMNVLYAGYNNPISVSVPGVPLSQVTATMDGGSLTKTAEGKYIARPSKMGKATISVFSNASGKQQQMAQYEFRVRKLPEPTTYITIKDEKGNSERYFGGAVPEGRPALAPEGTDFQRAVWDVLLTIPYGETRTYGEIAAALAHRLGRSVSARAVGGAVGSNPISLIIPCHRVLGAVGKLTGYAGGLERKTALLRLEGVLPR